MKPALDVNAYNAAYYATYEALQKLRYDSSECYRRSMAAAVAAGQANKVESNNSK